MMANTTKTSWRLQEIVAHSSHVSVLALGKTSGRLVATGGEDCRVNIWAVNKPNCIMSLTGHSHPVECVQFSCSEEQVVAGSRTGALRIWDLEAAKILRTLVGHKANIRSLDFHPFGEYLASGSVDTNIKLWDVRRKGCVFRYKGHTQTVRCLAFSPDGKWLASSSDDSTVKLWDLTAGKMISEFTAHTGAVNAVQFHPNEYLLASGSSDGTIKLWDLEKFQMIGSSEDDTGPVRCIAFDPEGCCLFSGSQDTLRVFGWEPDRCFDLVSVGWGKVADLAVCNDQLIGVSCHLTNVSSYVVDLNGVKKSGSAIQDDKPVARPKGTSMRRSYELPLNTCSGQRVKRSSDSGRRSPVEGRRSPSSEEEREEEREEESAAEIRNAEDYKEIFQPKSAISRSPPKKSEPFPAPLDDESFPVKLGLTAETRTALPNKLALGQLKNLPMASSPPVVRVEPTVATTRPPPLATPMLRPPPLATAVARPSPVATSTPRPIPVEMPPARSLPVAPPVAQPVPAIAPRQSKPEPVVIFSSRNEPIGLNVGDFLPSPRSSEPAALNEEDALAQIHKGHQTMRVMLSGRNQNLSNVRASWTSVDVKASGVPLYLDQPAAPQLERVDSKPPPRVFRCEGSANYKTSLDSAVAINDLSIVVDILNIVNLKPSIWKLDLCTSVLPLIEELLQSKYESYIQTGCTSLKLILKRFWPLISDTLTAPPSVGVDITREERHQKCKACYKLLKGLSGMVKTKAGQVGRNGSAFQELQLLLDPLDY